MGGLPGTASAESLATAADVRFFQVVSRSLVGKHFLSTASLARMRLMRVPLVLQRLAIAGERPGAQATRGLAHLEGTPEVVDLKQLGTWADTWRRLRIWKLGGVTAAGALRLVEPRIAADVRWTVARARSDGLRNALGWPKAKQPLLALSLACSWAGARGVWLSAHGV